MSKYHSSKATCNSLHVHDSIKEANRCNELTLMEKSGWIIGLKQQPRFELKPAFSFKGEKIRKIEYVADFGYFDKDTETWCIEDTKGFKTEIYKLKIKLLKYIMREAEDFLFIES
jgi:hypothetical protein